MTKPTTRPVNPNFSSGPCAKIPGFTLAMLQDAPLGRSHRAKIGKTKLEQLIQRSKQLLNLPEGYELGIVAGSDTGAFEMAMWNLLGERGVDVFAWEAFSTDWLTDITKQLKLKDVRSFTAAYGELPDLSHADKTRDIVFAWNGTTSGVCVPHGDWIADDRTGLTLCDATSAVFAMDLPWEKLDVVTYSWQKVMGGEAAHGILILSPRAIARLNSYQPGWPLPKIFQLTKKGQFAKEIFEGATINTPSMLCVEDALVALDWMEQIGGLKEVQKRSRKNLETVANWVKKTPWIDFLPVSEDIRSSTSICLKFAAAEVAHLDEEGQQAFAKQVTSVLEKEGVAYDIGAYRTAPAGIRIWGGATVETSDIEALLPWLEWAYTQAISTLKQAA